MKYNKETYYSYLMELLPESNFTLDVFSGTEKPCEFTCNICGMHHTFTEANKIARRAKRGNKNVCKNCENNKWNDAQREAKNKALNMLKKKQTIELVGEIKTWASREKCEWKCTKCNHTFFRSPFVMFNSQYDSLTCPWCESRPFQYTEEMIEDKAKDLWGTEYSFLGTSANRNKNQSKRVIVKHNKCGFKYEVSLWNFLHGQGCPRCKASHGERKVRKYLDSHNFIYQEQKSIAVENTYLKLDFYLENNGKKYAVEYNGIQHYKSVEYFNGEEGLKQQQYRDNLKKIYCKENNIDLIIIPYNDESIIQSEELAQRLNG